MVTITEIQLQQDGNTVYVQFDGKYVRSCAAVELSDDRVLDRMREDIESNLLRVAEARKRFCGGNLIAFPPSTPRAPLGIEA